MISQIANKYHKELDEYERTHCVNGSPSFFCEFFAVAQHAKKAFNKAKEEAKKHGYTEKDLRKHIAVESR